MEVGEKHKSLSYNVHLKRAHFNSKRPMEQKPKLSWGLKCRVVEQAFFSGTGVDLLQKSVEKSQGIQGSSVHSLSMTSGKSSFLGISFEALGRA